MTLVFGVVVVFFNLAINSIKVLSNMISVTQGHSIFKPQSSCMLYDLSQTKIWFIHRRHFIIQVYIIFSKDMEKFLISFSSFKKLNQLNDIFVYIFTAKSLQSCPTLCDPTDGSPRGSPIPGILQARTLEWVAISFSNA